MAKVFAGGLFHYASQHDDIVRFFDSHRVARRSLALVVSVPYWRRRPGSRCSRPITSRAGISPVMTAGSRTLASAGKEVIGSARGVRYSRNGSRCRKRIPTRQGASKYRARPITWPARAAAIAAGQATYQLLEAVHPFRGRQRWNHGILFEVYRALRINSSPYMAIARLRRYGGRSVAGGAGEAESGHASYAPHRCRYAPAPVGRRNRRAARQPARSSRDLKTPEHVMLVGSQCAFK